LCVNSIAHSVGHKSYCRETRPLDTPYVWELCLRSCYTFQNADKPTFITQRTIYMCVCVYISVAFTSTTLYVRIRLQTGHGCN